MTLADPQVWECPWLIVYSSAGQVKVDWLHEREVAKAGSLASRPANVHSLESGSATTAAFPMVQDLRCRGT
jgi:hypothetical protein